MSPRLLDDPVAAPASAGPSASSAVTTARRIITWSLALFVALRLGVVVAAATPTVTPDEFGSWAIARHLVGGDGGISMRDMPRYSLVPGLLLAPIEALHLHPVAAYRAALALMSLGVLAAAELTRRAVKLLVPDAPVLAAAAFALTLLFPATFVTSTMTWAEPTVLLWWAVLLWGVAHLAYSPATGALLLTSVAAGLAPFVHGRLTAVPLVWMVALAVRALRDRRDPTATVAVGVLAGVPVTLVVALVARAVDGAVGRAVWTTAYSPASEGLAGAAGTEPWWRGLGAALVGQTWYVLVASAGLALLGAALLFTSARRPQLPGSRLFALTLGAMLTSNLAASALSAGVGMSALYGGTVEGTFGGTRWDHAVYGRYIDAAVLVLSVLGLILLWQRGRSSVSARLQGAAAAATVATGIGVGLLHRGRDLGPSLDVTIAGLTAISRSGDGLHLVHWTGWAVLALAAMGLALRRSRTALLMVLAVWLTIGAVGGARLAIGRHEIRHQPDWTAVGAPGPGPGGTDLTVATDAEHDPYLRLNVFGLQRDLSWLGWQTRFDDGDSAALASSWERRSPRPDALVLLEGIEPAGEGWNAVLTFGGSVIWRR